MGFRCLCRRGSPSGRLTTTVYPDEFVQQRNMTDYQLAPHDTPAGHVPGVTYVRAVPRASTCVWGFVGRRVFSHVGAFPG